RGDVVKREGESPRCALLARGLCAYEIRQATAGLQSVMALITPGCCIADVSAVLDLAVNIRTVAWQDCEVLALPPSALLEEADRDCGFARALSRYLATKQLSLIEGMAATFTLEPQMRLKVLLKALITAYGQGDERAGRVVPVLLNNTQYGQVVHLSRVSVSRIFSQWQKEGLMVKRGRTLVVSPGLFDDVDDWIDGRGAAANTRLDYLLGDGHGFAFNP
ncbi:MAG: Crp/Fnr family transcriptional regulator, partial [Duodenibacillus sp.]|nr:Crp/Fnr family transcriptional regulator [Duodenibacillus sp.]